MNRRFTNGLLLVALFMVGHAHAADTKPLKVFILAGQSNMQGHAHTRTFNVIGMDETTAPLLKKMQNEDGTPRECENVWITSIGSSAEERSGKLTAGFGAEAGGPKIGPEFTFGIYMQEKLDEPILIIKTAWGGKSINTDFRPPSAGPYEFNENQLENFEKQGKDIAEIKAERAKATGHYYRLMTEHVQSVLKDIKRVYPDYDEKQGYELAGFVWFQGWNDMVDGSTYPNRGQEGSYDDYSTVLVHFIRDVRKDLAAPKMPFVIGVMGAGGPVAKYTPDKQRYAGIHQTFRDAMAAPAGLPEFKGNVAAVLTENYWDMPFEALKLREQKLKAKKDEINAAIKEGSLTRDKGNTAIEELYTGEFKERELVLLRESTSNAEYHYLGSAKILAQIGKGFAEATFELMQQLDDE